MLSDFIAKKMADARYKLLKDGSYFGEIHDVRGVWANGRTLEVCREELREVLEDWLVLALKNGDRIPGLKIKMDKRALAKYA